MGELDLWRKFQIDIARRHTTHLPPNAVLHFCPLTPEASPVITFARNLENSIDLIQVSQ